MKFGYLKTVINIANNKLVVHDVECKRVHYYVRTTHIFDACQSALKSNKQ